MDIRYACRMLLKSPGFTIIAVVVLALGIGANTSIFTVVNDYLLRPMPFQEPERLVSVYQVHKEGRLSGSASYPDYLDWREQNQVFTDITASNGTYFNLTGAEEAERVLGRRVTHSFFPTLGVAPALGRGILAEEDRPGGARVAVIGYGFWQRRFAGKREALGSTLLLDGQAYTIVGVLPASFRFTNQPYEVWVPLALDREKPGRGNQFLGVIARMKPGVTLARAQADMKMIAERLAQQYPAQNGAWTAGVESLWERFTRGPREPLQILLATVGFVLLLACANVANLLLARGAGRQKEMAIRAALGAGRFRLLRQGLTESLILAMLGGAGGSLLAYWSVRAVYASIPARIQPPAQAPMNLTVLAYTLGISILTGVLFGLAPALTAGRTRLNETLKEGGRGSASGRSHARLRGVLVVSEVAIAVLLLIGAALLAQSFARLQQVDPGFRSDGVLTLALSLPETKYPKPDQRAAFFSQVLERVSALPGVLAAGGTTGLPMSGSNSNSSFTIEGRPPLPPGQFLYAGRRVVTPGYFRVMGIPLLSGRAFTAHDRDGSLPVAIVNATMAEKHWPGESPLGKRFQVGGTKAPWATVVGVIGNVKYFGLDGQAWPEMFLPADQARPAAMALTVRTAAEPASMASAVRAAIRAVDRDVPVSNVAPLRTVVSDSMAPQRVTTVMLMIYAGIALVLAAIGLYGVIAYSVSQRSHEIGIRLTLGAGRADVLRLVVGQGMLLALIGVGIGLAGAFGLMRLMKSMLFGVTATDPVTFAGCALALTAVALAASYVPARRAARVDPIVALRYE